MTTKHSMRYLRALAPFVIAASVYAQSNIFTPGNIVVTRSVYAGDQTTITVGQALPPICPSTAACGTGTATSNGQYPNTANSSNVWNNDTADGSFGITSPIFVDQLTAGGSPVSSIAIPTNMAVTSFSSKSELAVNLSTDGTALTMNAYIAPSNAVDVSNSNTPGAYDPTNPVGSSYFRGVLQIGANGAMMVTPTNAYSGNNGRASMLANGLYYMAGNDNNGSGTPANIIDVTGVEIATPGQSATTAPTMVGSFSIAQYNNPTTGAPYTADKAGKDNNFRGLTIFNNTLYVTKGSGGNGMNTVYQVGTAGNLPTIAGAANTPITVLPGFPTSLAKTAGITNIFPFGIWFANATTLYVGDEGDGTAADDANSTLAGLQKWSLVNGSWTMDYVLQKGLNLGVPYTVANYPASLNPSTAGLRNITGRVNGDGTVTIWAVTSTTSANGDQGADPNQLVMINDTLANMTASSAASESFTIIKSAKAGEVLRGVSLVPSAPSNMANVPLVLSAATPSVQSIAPGEVASANGQNLSSGFPGPIFGLLPTVFNDVSVTVTDAGGNTNYADLYYVSPNEVQFIVPSNAATGMATVSVSSNGVTQTTKNVAIAPVAPAMFTLNNAGLATAYAVRVSASGTQTIENVYSQSNSTGLITPTPVNLGAATDKVYLTLYGTGFDSASASQATVTINGVTAPVLYAGPNGQNPGIDQINVQIPASLAGKGNVNVQTTVGGVTANPVQITIM